MSVSTNVWRLSLGIGILAACGSATDSSSTTVVDSAGIRIVTHSGPDSLLDWTFRPIDSLGGDTDVEGPTSFYHVGRFGVGADDQGHAYVLDIRGRRVVKFGRDGEVVGTLGREGEGPGELRNATSLSVRNDGAIGVFDFARMGIVTYAPDGTPGPVVFLGEPAPSFDQRHFADWGDGWAVMRRRPHGADSVMHVLALETPRDTSEIAAIVRPAPSMVMYESCGGGLSLPPVFSQDLLWATGPDALAIITDPEYTIERIADDGSRTLVRRTLPARAATAELAARELGEGFRINFGQGPCVIDPAEMVEGRGFAPTVPAIGDVEVDREGRLWVQRRVVQGEGSAPIDLFDPAGTYIGTLRDLPMPVVFLGAGKVGWVAEDSSGIQRLILGSVQRGNGS